MFWLKRKRLSGSYLLLDAREPVEVAAERAPHQVVPFLAQPGKIEVDATRDRSAAACAARSRGSSRYWPRRARRPARSSRSRTCTAWIDRRRRCRLAPTRAVAPPKFQIDDSVLATAAARCPRRSASITASSSSAQVVALPVAAVLAERDERIEQPLDVAVGHLAREVGDELAAAHAAAAAAARPRRRRRRTPRRWCRSR